MFIVSDLTLIGFTKTDYPNTAINGREAQHVQPRIQKTHRHVTYLRVSFAHIPLDDCTIKIEVSCSSKRQAMVTDVGVVLVGVELDMHKSNCSNTFTMRQGVLSRQAFVKVLSTLDHPLRTVNVENSRFEAQGWIERFQKRMLLRVICENGEVVTVVTVMATSKFEKYGVTP